MTTKVKILKCNDPMKWYSDMIGKQHDVIYEEKTEWLVREPAGYINFISKEDSEVVNSRGI
jgi:hypothetical protein